MHSDVRLLSTKTLFIVQQTNFYSSCDDLKHAPSLNISNCRWRSLMDSWENPERFDLRDTWHRKLGQLARYRPVPSSLSCVVSTRSPSNHSTAAGTSALRAHIKDGDITDLHKDSFMLWLYNLLWTVDTDGGHGTHRWRTRREHQWDIKLKDNHCRWKDLKLDLHIRQRRGNNTHDHHTWREFLSVFMLFVKMLLFFFLN